MSKPSKEDLLQRVDECRALQWKLRKKGMGCARSVTKREWDKSGTLQICCFCMALKANGIDPEQI